MSANPRLRGATSAEPCIPLEQLSIVLGASAPSGDGEAPMASQSHGTEPEEESSAGTKENAAAADEAIAEPSPAGRGPSEASRLVSLLDRAELFHTPQGETFATVSVGNHTETHALQSKWFGRWIKQQWYAEFQTVPRTQAVAEALGVLDARGAYDGPAHPVFVRLGNDASSIYLDLANDNWELVAISASGWAVTRTPWVRFRRPHGMRALPRPTRGASIDLLRPFLNLETEDDFILVVSWLVAALRPQGPYPVLILQGEQGSAKTTLARVLRALLDPNGALLRSEPRDGRDLMIAALNSWIQAYDNLSHIRPWLSDALCRLATGGGFATRELFTNTEEAIFEAQRPVLFNGIEDVATRSDLLDRAIVLRLPPIPAEARKTEETFWREFEEARPAILGALLDAVCVAMRLESAIALPTTPRMADFAVWASACAPKFGWGPAAFHHAYAGNRESADEVALEGSPVPAALRELLTEAGDWVGSYTELYNRLQVPAPAEDRRRLNWPGSPQALSGVLRRLAPNLRAVGIEVKVLSRKHGGKRGVSIRGAGKVCVTHVTSVTKVAEGAYSGGLDAATAPALASTETTLRHPGAGCVTGDEAQ